jgi:ankyrin repeat protein
VLTIRDCVASLVSQVGNVDVVTLLLDYGADVNFRDTSMYGSTALGWACAVGQTQVSPWIWLPHNPLCK